MSTFWDDPPLVVKIHNFFFFSNESFPNGVWRDQIDLSHSLQQENYLFVLKEVSKIPSQNAWIFGLDILDLNFGLDNISFLVHWYKEYTVIDVYFIYETQCHCTYEIQILQINQAQQNGCYLPETFIGLTNLQIKL